MFVSADKDLKHNPYFDCSTFVLQSPVIVGPQPVQGHWGPCPWLADVDLTSLANLTALDPLFAQHWECLTSNTLICSFGLRWLSLNDYISQLWRKFIFVYIVVFSEKICEIKAEGLIGSFRSQCWPDKWCVKWRPDSYNWVFTVMTFGDEVWRTMGR